MNDNDALIALKYTYKGISGLGEDGASVHPSYRHVDPSHIGIIDLDSSTSSDPGLSGMLVPLKKLYPGGWFKEFEEPNTWRENWAPIKEQYKQGTTQPIEFEKEPSMGEDYFYNIRERIVQEELELNRIRCPIENINDPSIMYTCSQAMLDKQEEQPQPSLFTIKPREE